VLRPGRPAGGGAADFLGRGTGGSRGARNGEVLGRAAEGWLGAPSRRPGRAPCPAAAPLRKFGRGGWAVEGLALGVLPGGSNGPKPTPMCAAGRSEISPSRQDERAKRGRCR
jgi:hypothetical protein